MKLSVYHLQEMAAICYGKLGINYTKGCVSYGGQLAVVLGSAIVCQNKEEEHLRSLVYAQ